MKGRRDIKRRVIRSVVNRTRKEEVKNYGYEGRKDRVEEGEKKGVIRYSMMGTRRG